MTVNELKNSVASLGFERDIEDENAFILATERALNILFRDLPKTVTRKLICDCPDIIAKYGDFKHKEGETEEFPLNVGAYSFRLCGEGKYEIDDGERCAVESFNTRSSLVRGFIKKAAKIRFLGDCCYTVTGFANFGMTSFRDVSSIPEYGKTRFIDLKEEIPDFISLVASPTLVSGNVLSSASVKDGVLEVPFEFQGELNLTYERSPKTVLNIDFDSDIDCPHQYEHLLSLLVSSFIWLDDSPDKATYYMSLYKEGVSMVKSYTGMDLGTKYTTNGWA